MNTHKYRLQSAQSICIILMTGFVLFMPHPALCESLDAKPTNDSISATQEIPKELTKEEKYRILRAKRPVTQTVFGAILVPLALFVEGLGIWCEVTANSIDVSHSDDAVVNLMKSGNSSLKSFYEIAGAAFIIGGIPIGIAGTVLCVRAKRNWDDYNDARLRLHLSYDPPKQRLGTVASIGF